MPKNIAEELQNTTGEKPDFSTAKMELKVQWINHHKVWRENQSAKNPAFHRTIMQGQKRNKIFINLQTGRVYYQEAYFKRTFKLLTSKNEK